MEKTGRRKLKVMGLAIAVVLLLVGLALMMIDTYVKHAYKDRVITPQQAALLDADCVLILGAGVWDSGPSPMLEDRLIQGVDLYWKGASGRLLMSGDHGSKEYDEVNIMKNFAIERDVPSGHVFMDHAGFSTYESMYRARDIFLVKKTVIVTQKYHLYRALYVANQLGLDAYGVSSDPRPYAGQEYREKREMLARVKDFFTVFFQPEPTYLGESMPIDGNGDLTNDDHE